MSGSQSMNLTYDGVKTCSIPQVTNPIQDVSDSNQVEPEIDVVGLDIDKNTTQNKITNDADVGDITKEPQPQTSSCHVDPAVDNQISDFEHNDTSAQSKPIPRTSQTESVTVTHHQDICGEISKWISVNNDD